MSKTRVVSCLLIIALIFTACAKTVAPLTAAELLDLGNNYLAELNYEQALVCFDKLIEVEPKNPRGYLGAAEAYIALGETGKAIEILQIGINNTDDERLADLLNELLPPPVVTTTPIATTTPITTELHVTTTEPEITEPHVTTTAPETTELPVITTAPETAEAPVTTPAPKTTESTVTTEPRVTTTTPEATEPPAITSAPITTPKPTGTIKITDFTPKEVSRNGETMYTMSFEYIVTAPEDLQCMISVGLKLNDNNDALSYALPSETFAVHNQASDGTLSFSFSPTERFPLTEKSGIYVRLYYVNSNSSPVTITSDTIGLVVK